MNIVCPILCVIILFLSGCQHSNKTEQPALENSIEEKRDEMKDTYFKAVEKGNIEEVSRFLEQGTEINSKDHQGRTAVMLATYAKNAEMVKFLIDKGADVNIQDQMKNSPFLFAGAEGYLEILKLTIGAGADPKILNRYGGTALIPASEHGYVDVVKLLLEQTTVDVNHVNNLGWTALMEAVILSNGGKTQQDTIKLLIEHGADVNIPDSEGITPLQHAKARGFTEIRDILLQAGAK